MTWITPSATRNYMLKDPICDWLELFSNKISSGVSDNNNISSKPAKPSNSFLNFLLNQGVKFEAGVVSLLKERFPTEFIDLTNVDPEFNVGSNLTINAMIQGYGIIYQGKLIDEEEHIRGIPDIIIRSDLINKLTTTEYLTEEDASVPCFFSNKFHYRILDIKFTTLCLRSSGINLLNSGSVPAFKAQVYLYTKMLGKIQKYQPNHGYILGRRWKFSSKANIMKGHSCFERLGDINFEGFDKPIINQANKAVEWLKLLHKEGHTWNIDKEPLCRPELYPNMSNTHDAPWRSIKKVIAQKINEITLLWMCGPKNRNKSHDQGVYNWKDERCTSEILGINGKKTKKILDTILKTN